MGRSVKRAVLQPLLVCPSARLKFGRPVALLRRNETPDGADERFDPATGHEMPRFPESRNAAMTWLRTVRTEAVGGHDRTVELFHS